MKKTPFVLLIVIGAVIYSNLLGIEEITSTGVKELPPVEEILHPIWGKIPSSQVTLIPQKFALPNLTTQSVYSIRVQSIHNGEWLMIRMIWNDPSRDTSVDVNKFTDQVAIQFPLNPTQPPSFMMGHQGGRVHLIHWKAIWQEDIEKGYRDVRDLHPNYWVDMYWFSDSQIYGEGEYPPSTPLKKLENPFALSFNPAVSLHNPVSQLHRPYPVEEAMAEGYGSFTSQPRQNARGWGIWKDGKWYVVIARPIISDDPLDAPITDKTFIAFAVWNGSDQQVGARKQVSPWVPFQLTRYGR
jgi:hypothetical protein